MKMNLNDAEVRVLGSLMEKELTTPENYPLSLNSLTSACNQKSNRDPVMNLTEAEVVRTLELLGNKGLARLTATGGRVAKYRHSVAEKLRLDAPSRAVLAELMLRGPQTASELRSRAERMAPIADFEAAMEIIATLQRHGPPLVALLPRQQGRKEQRYAQLFTGTIEIPDTPEAPELTSGDEGEEGTGSFFTEKGACPAEPSPPLVSRQDRLDQLEAEVASLRLGVTEARRMVEELTALFQ